MLSAELLLGMAGAAGPASAAALPLEGTPYTSAGSYDVSVPHIIINQVYGGGDALTTDGYFSSGFIELYNPGSSDVNLSGWSVQYSDPGLNGVWRKLELNGIIKAHSSYLITDSKVNPAFKSDLSGKGDQIWPDLLFYNKGMKVVLLSNQTLLQTVNPFQNKPEGYVDMIGTAGNDAGSVIDGYEGDYPTGKTGGTSKQKSVRRTDFTDSDNNKTDLRQTDFASLDAGAMNLARPHNSADGPWGVTVPELAISTIALPDATAASPYTATLAVYGGVKPYTFAAKGLPEGLKLEPDSGVISGTPVSEMKATVSISVYDSSVPRRQAEANLSLAVGKAAAPAQPDKLSMTKIGGYSVGVTSEDGGVAEIVKYNRDNGKFYLVNGSTQPASLDVVNLKEGTHPEKEKSINVEQLSETGGFRYGDLTSVDINPATKRIAVAVQEEDAMKNGKILVLDYDGSLLDTYEAGVQPDMIKYTEDGRYILTADEAEPRSMEGDPEGSVTIVDTVTRGTVYVKFDQPELIADSVHIRGAVDPLTKLITGEGDKRDAVRDLEPEFIELSADQKTAYVALQENNAVAAVDIASRKILWVKGLGLKDFSKPDHALDLLKDSRVQLENAPFYGAYMPDGISQYTVNGKTYLFTANEGDATEWDSKENATTIGKMKASLHPDSPASRFLKGTTKYDSVEVMSDMGHDGIYLYGGRSFSVWNADTMKQVYDSGSDFEKITGERLPDYFNASNSNTTLDSRSTKKGPEPEYVKVGQVGQKALAFIGLERIGGLMTYDVTNPEQPQFVNYLNTRIFTPKNNLETDTGPEGIEFIPAPASPTGLPLVLVANEVGGTVAIYQLNVAKVTLDQKALSLKAGGASATLQATVQSAGGEQQGALSWQTSNPSVASVSQKGTVTPLAAGSAVISVYSADGYGMAEVRVTVTSSDAGGPTPSPAPGVPNTSSGSSGGTATPSPSRDVTAADGKVTVALKPSADATGGISYSVSAQDIEAAVESLKASAGKELVFRAAAVDKPSSLSLKVAAASLRSIVDTTAAKMTFTTGLGSVTLDRMALTSVNSAAGSEEISFTITRTDIGSTLASLGTGAVESAKKAVGSRPVIGLTIEAGTRIVSDFGNGSVTVTIPYIAAPGEDPAALTVYELTTSGGLRVIPASNYNTSAGLLTFRTSHFSVYAVGYHPVSFSDTGSSYAKDAITFLAARGIISGTGQGEFGLKNNLSRADAALLLARVSGAELNMSAASGSFKDVQAKDYYASAVAWANANGIVNGTGDGKFEPKAKVTREQFAVMMIRLAEHLKWNLPSGAGTAVFADQSAIPAYALDAVLAAQQAGIISGLTSADGGIRFAPKTAATREETAQILASLLKLAP